jgi:hypothetical protein
MLKSALFGVKAENNSDFCRGTVHPNRLDYHGLLTDIPSMLNANNVALPRPGYAIPNLGEKS